MIYSHIHKYFCISLLALVCCLCAQQRAFAVSEAALALNKRAEMAIASGRFDEAAKLLSQLMQSEPGWSRPYFTASKLCRFKHDRVGTVKNLRQACRLEPNNEEYKEAYTDYLQQELANARVNQRPEIAAKIEKEILAVQPGNLAAALPVMKKLCADGKFNEAKVMAEETLETNDKLRIDYSNAEYGEVFFVLAGIHLEQNDYYEARRNVDNALKYELERPEAAKALLSKIRKKQNDQINELVELAKKAQADGDMQKALHILESAKEVNPGSSIVQTMLDNIMASIDVKKAKAEAKKLIAAEKWLEARDLLEATVASAKDKEAAALLKKMTEKEEALLKQIGMNSRLPRDKNALTAMLDSFKTLGRQYQKVKNNKGARQTYEKGLAVCGFVKQLKGQADFFKAKIAEIDGEADRVKVWQSAIEARNSGDFEETLKLLKTLPKDYNIQLTSYVAEAEWKTGNEEEALANARYQLNIQPENNRAKFVLGSIMLEKNEKNTAYNLFKEIYDIDPDYPEIQDKLLLSSASKAPKYLPLAAIALLLLIAYALYKRLPEYNKNQAIKRAKSCLKRGDIDECIKEVSAVRRLPILTAYDRAIMTRIMAQAFLKKGIYDRAIGECKGLLAISQNDEEAHTWLGYAYLGKHMVTPESITELLGLYKKDSKNYALVSLLGAHYTQAKKLNADGVEILEQWLNLDPSNSEVLKPLGRYYLAKGRSDDKAMKVFKRMLGASNPEPEFMLGVAKIYLKLRQFNEALSICEQVINADANNELVHGILREVYAKQNRLGELIDIYGEFLKSNPYNVAFQGGYKSAKELLAKTQKQQAEAADMQQQGYWANPNEPTAPIINEQSGDYADPALNEAPNEAINQAPNETVNQAPNEALNGAPNQAVSQAPDQAANSAASLPIQGQAPSNGPLQGREQEIICPNCGFANNSQAYCCGKCGRNLL